MKIVIKKPKQRNLVAKSLFEGRQFSAKQIKSKKRYTRKEKHSANQSYL